MVKVEARARNKSGLASGWSTFTFGVGTAADHPASARRPLHLDFPVQAVAGSGATGARVEWRYAPSVEGNTASGWVARTKHS